MSDWSPPLMALLALERRLERGPKREGAFALWLTVRLALDIGTQPGAVEKPDRRRVALLSQRMTQLVVPRPLGRGLAAALGHLENATPEGARIALTQLVAPARDALGSEAGDAVALAARSLASPGDEAR